MSELSDARSIFLKVVEIEPLRERAEYLQSACGDDSALRGRVDALLRAYDDPDSFFEQPLAENGPLGEAPTIVLPQVPEQPGATVGRYKLLQEIGEGGFGVVYMAEQSEPVRRKVALKIIKPGMDSRQVIARFEAERQALALMDHHNIARVLDAGTTAAGLPYFVMELVKGVPITKYCDDAKLSPRERLELFLPVCHAVQHAHQKGVIHRDLKPSNVLVALYDGRPVPKVIDFGVAKATQQRLTERTMFTELGQVIGTFQYMSPEQAEMNQLDIDTRSDVYSLGVLLYELLIGSTPLAMQELREAGLVEMLRTIRETEPPKPSTRLSESGEALASISAVRQTEPDKLARLLRGDLDWIVMKALEKDRSRRYDSANDLAADIERHLHQEPVLAAAPSTSYRMRKFVSRNKPAVGAAALLAFLLLGFGVVSAYQAEVAKRSALRARTAEQEAQRSLDRAQQARQAAELDRERAETAEVFATSSEEQALDQLARSQYERARAIRLLGEPGARFQSLVLLEQAEELRSRPHHATEHEEESETAQLPTRSQLRSEAVAALLKPDGRVSRSWEGITHGVSPDGRFLASMWVNVDASNGGVRVVDVESGRSLYEVSGKEAEKFFSSSLAVGPGAKKLAAVQMDSHDIKLIDVATGAVERTLAMSGEVPAARSNPQGNLAFSPDGRWLVTASGMYPDREFVLWDLSDTAEDAGRVIAKVKGFPLTSANFAPDGKQLAWVSAENKVTLWNLLEEREQRTIELPLRLDGTVQFTPDGSKIVVHGYHAEGKKPDNTVVNNPAQFRPGVALLWDVEQQMEVARYETKLSFLPNLLNVTHDGRRIVIGQMNGPMSVIDLQSREQFRLDHGSMIQTLAWTDDGQHLVSAGPGIAKRWELASQTALEQRALAPRADTSVITRFAFGPNHDIVAAEFIRPHHLGLFEVSSGRRLRELEMSSQPFPSTWLTFSPDGDQLLRFGVGEVLVWDVNSDQEPRRIELERIREVYSSVGFRADGTILLAGLKNYIPIVREAVPDKTVWTLEKRMMGAMVRVSRDGQLVISHDEAFKEHPRSISVRSLPTGDVLHRFPSAAKGWGINTLLEISSDDRWVLELGVNTPTFAFATMAGPGRTGMASAMGGNDQSWSATLWNLSTGERHDDVQGESTADAMAFSPDGRFLAIAQRDGSVLIWNVEAKQKLFQWQAWPQVASLGGFTHQMEFSSDGRHLVVADDEAPAVNLLDLEKLQDDLATLGLGW